MIHYIIPWTSDKNLGKFYNEQFDRIGESDWICFLDGDAVFTGHYWGKRIEETIKANPQYDLFTCTTNRVGTAYQCIKGMWDIHDFRLHWNYGSKQEGTEVEDITHKSPISGVLILLSKKTWKRAGGFEERGMLGVDNSIHYRVSEFGKVGLMKNIYVFHYYRGGNPRENKHLCS